MDNTTYEFFIRRAWPCDRFEKGANTDTWATLLKDKFEYEEALGTTAEAKLEKQYSKTFQKVKTYIDNAYKKLLSRAEKAKLSLDAIETIKAKKVASTACENPEALFIVLSGSLSLINEYNL